MHVCVSKCPDKQLNTPLDVKAFANDMGSRLCTYDIPLEDYDDFSLYGQDGPCPMLPVLQRFGNNYTKICFILNFSLWLTKIVIFPLCFSTFLTVHPPSTYFLTFQILSISLMNRCFPDISVLAPESIQNTTLGIVQFFNADNIFRKVLRDMYSSKVEMLLLCCIALGKYQNNKSHSINVLKVHKISP